jgi:hypothetical protein
MALLFAGQLKRAGINARVRPVDAVHSRRAGLLSIST